MHPRMKVPLKKQSSWEKLMLGKKRDKFWPCVHEDSTGMSDEILSGHFKGKCGIKKQGLNIRLPWKSYVTVVAGTRQLKAPKRQEQSYKRKGSSLEFWSTLIIWGETKRREKNKTEKTQSGSEKNQGSAGSQNQKKYIIRGILITD